ncbi:MAG: S-layer homology domain-containing protein [Syntrophomonas sp.]|nr:S-layer homology domain-containing protein [Syntrophomonas sp.]
MKKYTKYSWLILAMFIWTIAFGITTPAAYASSDLTDINGHWAQSQIENLTAQNIISGYPDGYFKPDQTITRAEFTVVLVKAFKLEANNGEDFTDTADHWAKDYIATASACGIVNGYENGSFGPNDLITREQMAVMVVKAAKLDTIATGKVFSDDDKVSAWAKSSVDTASSYKIISGYPDNSFKPQGSATRAEAVVVIGQSIIQAVPGAKVTGLGVLQMGETTTATATTTEAGAGGWTSSDPSVAIVDVNAGIVAALKAGTTTISYTISTSGKTNSKEMTVYPEATINNPSIGVVQVGAESVTPTSFTAADGTEIITWTSSDMNKATIDEKTGVITAIDAGDIIIAYEVTKEATGKIVVKGSLAITVVPAVVPGAEITGLGLLQMGETTTATADTIEPGAGGWTSSNPTVATVNATTGSVVALKSGTTNIGYTISTSAKVNSKAITVYAEAIVNNPSIRVVQVGAGTITPTSFTPADSTETISWLSTDTDKAKIDETTGVITAVEAGDTIIAYEVTKKSTGNIVAKGSLAITVIAAVVPGAPVTGLGVLQMGETTTATAATTEVGDGGWTSSNPTVATVDSTTGVVTALKAGTTNISYTVSTSGNLNSKAITVYAVATVNNPTIGVVQVGAGTVKPTGFTAPRAIDTIAWTSSDPTKATVDVATGVITPVAAGDTTISYTVKYGSRIIAKGSMVVAVQP